MFKKIIMYIVVIIVSASIGFFIRPGSGNNTDIEKRIDKLETTTNEIRDNQRKIETGIESIGIAVDGTRKEFADLAGRFENIETGIDRIEKNNNDNIESIGKLITGNNNAKGASQEIESIDREFGNILDGIEKRNK